MKFSDDPDLNDLVEMEIVSLLNEDKKLEAVKHCREVTGWSLMEAKQAVERVEAEHRLGRAGGLQEMSQPEPMPREVFERETLRLFENRGKLAAVKYYRDQTGSGLAVAKTEVEALAARHGLQAPSSGCAGMLLLGLVGLGGMVAIWNG